MGTKNWRKKQFEIVDKLAEMTLVPQRNRIAKQQCGIKQMQLSRPTDQAGLVRNRCPAAGARLCEHDAAAGRRPRAWPRLITRARRVLADIRLCAPTAGQGGAGFADQQGRPRRGSARRLHRLPN
jgi:hypothetical protein